MKRLILNRLMLFGVGQKVAVMASHAVVVLYWVGIFFGVVVALFAPAVVESFSISLVQGRGVILLIGVLSSLVVVWFDMSTRKKHESFLNLLSVQGNFGFRIGSLLGIVPLLVLVIAQSLRFQIRYYDTVLSCFAFSFITAISVLLLIRKNTAHRLFARVICCVAIFAVGLLSWNLLEFPMMRTWIVQGRITDLLIGLILSICAGVATQIVAARLGLKRLAPHTPRAHRNAGVLIGSVFAISSFVEFVIVRFHQFAHIAELLPIAATLLALLLLRVRCARYVNVEAFGLGLLFIRDLMMNSGRAVLHFRQNWILLSLPTVLVGLVLLFRNGMFAGMVFLISLVFLECAVDEIAIQRRTTVLPASMISTLGYQSISGLGAGIGIVVVFSAAGALGMTPAIDLRAESGAVLIASVLFFIVAGILFWLRHADSRHWLTSIEVQENSKNV